MKGASSRRQAFLPLLICLCAGAVADVQAQATFPAKPITIQVGFAPGGSTDLIVRALAKASQPYLGQPLIVGNSPGAGGTLALVNIMNKEPDGYTLATVTTGALSTQHTQEVSYNVLRDFTPIVDVVSLPAGLAVRADAPWKSLAELIAYAKANPKKLAYSTAGVGLAQHLTMERLAVIENVQWIHVPYRGGVDAVAAVLGGHVQAVSQLTEWKPHVDQGALRLLVLYGEKRMPQYPNVPTLKDLGYKFAMAPDIGLVGPKGVTPERANLLANAFKKAMDDPEYNKVKDSFFMSNEYKDPQAFAKSLAELDANIKGLVEKLGLAKAAK